MRLLVEENDGTGESKRWLTRSSMEEVNLARKVAGLVPWEDMKRLRRETNEGKTKLNPLVRGGGLSRNGMAEEYIGEEFNRNPEVEEMARTGGEGTYASQSTASASITGIMFTNSDDANNNIVIEGKFDQVNGLDDGQPDAAAVVEQLINVIIERAVDGSRGNYDG